MLLVGALNLLHAISPRTVESLSVMCRPMGISERRSVELDDRRAHDIVRLAGAVDDDRVVDHRERLSMAIECGPAPRT